MKTKFKWLPVFAAMLSITACNKYLDVKPVGYQLLITASDFDQWLNSPELTYEQDIPNINRFTDNVDVLNYNVNSTASSDLMFKWASQFSTDPSVSPVLWSSFYHSIYYFNTVVSKVDGATAGSDQQKAQLKAEALLGRAYEYLYLVNLYGKEYDQTTAAQDLAVPFVTAADVTVTTPPRSSVKEIYRHIIDDLNAALPDLPADNAANRYRGSRYAAYSVLARAYFYMRDYPNAQKYAQLALTGPSVGMIDYNTITSISATTTPTLPLLATRKDVIYGRMCQAFSVKYTTPSYSPVIAAIPFFESYDASDLRLNFFKLTVNTAKTPLQSPVPTRGSIYYFTSYLSAFQQNAGTTVGEMKLIIAEAATRSNDLTTALQQLNDLRKYRFKANNYTQLSSTDQATVLNWVLRERNFELPLTGLRWLDMRRMDAEGLMPAVNRYDAQGNVVATLAPHSARYTLQIPTNVLEYNPNMSQNP